MIGVLAVSHSAALAAAAVSLAQQMVPGATPLLRQAAGAGTEPDGSPVIGTDAALIAAQLDALADDGATGIVVLMDLGSALLSAEMGVELMSASVPVVLSPGPFVEGLVAAVVSSVGGGDLEAVAREAGDALAPKAAQLGDAVDVSVPADVVSGRVSRIVTVTDPHGMHARPASLIARAVAGTDAQVRLVRTGAEVPASSMMKLLTLGAQVGDELEISASGDEADAVIGRIVEALEAGVG